jgi:hypothetical protein
MAYPESIDKYIEKLNKKPDGSVYVIEEEITIVEGKYEGILAHDNVTAGTIKVYTGSKMTGNEIKSFFVSVPAETPWKRFIKIFADTAAVYVTYETAGDTVEADDINALQEGMRESQKELDRYKAYNDSLIAGLDGRLEAVMQNKAEKAYVDGQLTGKVDKIPGKGLSAEDYTTAEKTKLAGISANANNYVHPASHPPSIIVQDAGNRFVTDSDITAWNGAAAHISDSIRHIAATERTLWNTVSGKVDAITGKQLSTEDYTTAEKTKLAGIAAGANNYVHPTTDGNKHVPANGTTNNGKVLKAAATSGTYSWGMVDYSELTNKPDLSGFITQEDLEGLGAGDMLKSVYDTDSDGKVDAAEAADTAPWNGITGKPAAFPPAAHNHDAAYMRKGPVTWDQLKGV